MAPKHRLHRSYRTRIFVVAGSVFIVVLAGALLSRSVWQDKTVATNATASPTPSPTPAKTQTPTPTDTPTPSAPKSQVDKVVVIMLENKSSTQIRTEAPRLTALGDRFGKAPRALAPCDHPSQPNYVCLSTGGRYVSSNSIKTLSNPDLWNNTLASGRTMKVYADSLPADVRDRRKNVGKYAARHVFTVPFVATTAKAANFSRYTVNAETLATDVAKGALPNVGALIPDNCHNAHDRCSGAGPTQIKQADNWIADKVELLQSGPDWKSGRLLIVVTADEDNKEGPNDISMIAIHPSLSSYSTEVPVTLFSVGGFLADVGHTPRLGRQATDPDFAEAFGLTTSKN